MLLCTYLQAKSLAIELFKWVGAAVKPTLEKSLKPVQVRDDIRETVCTAVSFILS